ncbi:hypothetical protein GDO86_006415 [Hymenochirus boettgeri]|uniref:Treslin n=1 Tax=Hymenochirus boettgeri TaxID=247094 RepID=A0A8T2J613_9PIPI|nr:hypothetical protein GDO86_006415 [Hymenochirus boettgeri]
MAPSHNVVLLVDTADPSHRSRLRFLSLRLLNFLACRAGLGHVRWSYRFLNSTGGRCRPPRRSDLRELGPRGWDEFSDDLETCWERARNCRASGSPGSRAQLLQTALVETLSDFQWDRPDITSPTKPVRSRRGGRSVAVDEPLLKAESPSDHTVTSNGRNAVFLLSPCPRSRTDLQQFTATSGDLGVQQVMEKLLPKALQKTISSKKVNVYWLDTSHWSEFGNSSDHSGYWTMVETMQLIEGKILPSESILTSLIQKDHVLASSVLPLSIPSDSVLNYLIFSETDYQLWFPSREGILSFTGVEKQFDSPVTLEPLSFNQTTSSSLMNIRLKGTVKNWTQQQPHLHLDTWVLRPSVKDCMENVLLQQFLETLMLKGLHVVADVTTEDMLSRTGILSPFSGSIALLDVIYSERAQGLKKLQLQESHKSKEVAFSDLPDIVSSVLNYLYSSEDIILAPDIPDPEWVNQELSQSTLWTSSIVERWYSLSGDSGASCNLMESFRLINAASSSCEEHLKSDQELTHYLSEFYQKRSVDESGQGVQGENKKKRGLPRTPVRQKMKTMPRALQMLNAARLNVKAQKVQPDGVLPVPNERCSRMMRKSSGKQGGKLQLKPTGFKSEVDLFLYLNEEYEKIVSFGEGSVVTCARNAVAIIKSYMKCNGSEHVETDSLEKIRNLLKTSKVIRQRYGNNNNKEAKLRECEIQVYLRLEMSVQCSVLQTNTDEVEELVEEITDILRILSLTEDPLFLTKFLEGTCVPIQKIGRAIGREQLFSEEAAASGTAVRYISTVPKILADIYFSLGTQIPEELALTLPSDGDDSVLEEERNLNSSQPSVSRVPSVAQIGIETDQLEELRTRSAKKRRTSTLARHRSIAESSQIMRQIEVPKKQVNKENINSNAVVLLKKLKLPLPAQPQKDAEAKVRRNLFVQEGRSPTKRCSKMPRSQSVSAVEGIKHKRSKSHDGSKDHYKLLTKNVSETPIHKQTANRLLHKQIKGRPSQSVFNTNIVEESPEKDIRDIDLRRSPRIKQLSLTRRNSSSFYASQPKSRNLQRLNSTSQMQLPCDQPGSGCSSELKAEVKTPKRLLFGEVLGMNSPPGAKKARRLLDADPVVFQTPGKTPRRTQRKTVSNMDERKEEESIGLKHCILHTPVRSPKPLKTPSKSPSERKSAAKNLGKLFSPSKIEEGSPSKLWERKSERIAQMTPKKDCSQNMRSQTLLGQDTPQKGGHSVDNTIFKTPPRTPKRIKITPSKQNIKFSKTPSKYPLELQEPESSVQQGHILKTPQKHILPSVSHTPVKHVLSSVSHAPILHTPQKPILASVSHTPILLTPKKCGLSFISHEPIFQTPQKPVLDSISSMPIHQTNDDLLTPNKLILPSTSYTQSPKKYIVKELSVALTRLQECTPEKEHISNFPLPSITDSPVVKSFGLEKKAAFVQYSESPLKPCGSQVLTCAFNPLSRSNENNKFLKPEPSNESTNNENVTADDTENSNSSSMSIMDKSLSSVQNNHTLSVTSLEVKESTVVCDGFDTSSLDSQETSESFMNGSQTEESIDISEARVVSTESTELKMKVLITRKPCSSDADCLPTTPKCLGNMYSSSLAYGLRCTPDRRQREAAARLGNTVIPAKFSTPKSNHNIISQAVPTYEVELEMQDSGLPKLRFKRTDSSSTVDMDINRKESPNVSRKRKGGESPFNEKWCGKHPMKIESTCISPSFVRSAHCTPGKSGLQTFICQSYTPKRYVSAVASPSHQLGVSWTPSPKHKDKISTDVINSWPRKKKASSLNTNVLKGEKNSDYTNSLPPTEEEGGDFELEGISKLLEKSPVIGWQGKADTGTFGLRSRKRVFNLVSPTKETEHSIKRLCTVNRHEDIGTVSHRNKSIEETEIFTSDQSLSSTLSSSQHSTFDETFNSGFTPPNKLLKTPLSASGLMSLTQSPLLYKGKKPLSKQRRGIQDVFSDVDCDQEMQKLEGKANPASGCDDSPFSKAVSVGSVRKTYSRKKLLA